MLALISLLIGAIGIANTTLVAVLERTTEIGLRRALWAWPRHIAAQFLAESTALGTLGGLIGTCIGVATVVISALAKDWTTVSQEEAEAFVWGPWEFNTGASAQVMSKRPSPHAARAADDRD